MSTWLDWYVMGAREQLAQASPDAVKAMGVQTDREAMKLMTLGGLSASDVGSDLRHFQAMVLPFLMTEQERADLGQRSGPEIRPHQGWISHAPNAFQVPQDIVEPLLQGSAPDTEDWKKPLVLTTYFDFPGGLVVSESASIRACFTQPHSSDPDVTVAVAVVTAPASNQMLGRYTWLLGMDEAIENSASVAPPAREIIRVVERLIKLVVLYSLAQRDGGAGFRTLPQWDGDLAHRKKARARAKTHSLFTVHQLKRDEQTLPRTDHTGRQGTILNHLVDVRGHFRWQPWGPARSKRRLIWIEGHTRGSGEKRNDMDRLG